MQTFRIILAGLTTQLLMLSSPIYASTPIHISIQKWQTQNGTPVYFVAQPKLPFVDISVIFNAGSAYDGKKPGLANLTNALLSQGTINFNADVLAKRFDNIGADFYNITGKNSASLSIRTLTAPDKLSVAIETFSDIIAHPNFPISAFTREKNRALNMIKASQDDPATIADKHFLTALYGNLPYGHLPIGTKQSLERLYQGDVIHFYRQHYVAHNAKIVIVGDLTFQHAKTIADKLVASLSEGKTQSLTFTLPTLKAQTIQVDFPASQKNIRIGALGIARKNPDFLPLKVGNYILGGDSLSSMLGKMVRETKGLTYGIYSYFSAPVNPGPFIISFSSSKDKAANAITLTRKILSQYINDGPTEAQLQFAKDYMLGSFPLKLDSNSKILANVANIASFDLPLNYLETYLSRLNNITTKQIKTAMQKHLDPNTLITVIVGPAEIKTPAKTKTPKQKTEKSHAKK